MSHFEQKRLNARIMKWREMLKQGLHFDWDLLVRRVRKGIPPAMRIKVWPQLIHLPTLRQHTHPYSSLLIKECRDEYDIRLDIPRTWGVEEVPIMRDSLFNVLKALSLQFPKIGYCQGMNFLAMRLLEVVNDETVFYLITYVVRKNRAIYDCLRNPGFVKRQCWVFSELLENHLPKIHKILTEQNIDPIMYTPPWFLTLFSSCLSQQLFYRFFECFLIDGYSFMYKMALALLQVKEKQILQNNCEENLLFLSEMNYYSIIPDDDLISKAVGYSITNQRISGLENTYNQQNQKQITYIEKKIKQSYIKRVLSPRRMLEWTVEDFRKIKAPLVKFEDQE